MAKINEADPTEPDDRLDVRADRFPSTGAEEGDDPDGGQLTVDEKPLPVEPAVETTRDPDTVLGELLGFYIYGDPVPDAGPGGDAPLPALLHHYRDLTRIRYDYPICLLEADGDDVARPLTAIIDQLADTTAPQGDEGERFRHHLYLLETEIRALAEGALGAPLTQLWDAAADNAETESTLPAEKKTLMVNNLAAARKALDFDGEVHGCRENIPARVFAAVATQQWKRCCTSWREELDSVTRQLEDILRVDSSHSPQANSPESLRSSTGSVVDDEMDFQAMSEILSRSHLGEPLPEARRERIRGALNMIRLVQTMFRGEEVHSEVPVNPDSVLRGCAAALEQYHSRMRVMTDFFRAVRIGRIEIANGYRDDVHGPFFGKFDVTYLTEEELSLCPPVLLALHQKDLGHENMGALMNLLSSGAPIKVLLVLDDLLTQGSTTGELSLMTGWAARLASMAMSLNHVYVAQFAVSNLALMKSTFAEGYGYTGPALFSVYTGNTSHHPGVPIYLNASASTESRAFPTFRFDPSHGATWADRMDITDNPQHRSNWPSDEFAYINAEETKVRVEIPFTLADFFALDSRLAAHFLAVEPDRWHRNMVPFHEFIEMDDESADQKIPYLTAVDSEGRVCRLIASREVVASVEEGDNFWNSLQELGGVNNSHANALVEAERSRLEEEKSREMDALEEKYRVDLERDIGELTEEIVARIASQLLAEGVAGAPGFIPPAAPRVAPTTPVAPTPIAPDESAPAQAPAEEADDDDDDVVTLDDPYIDTPLCTSCNDCFKVNSRLFAYDDNKQAYITDPKEGTFREMVMAAEACPVKIIHPGKPQNPDESGLDELIKRAEAFK